MKQQIKKLEADILGMMKDFTCAKSYPLSFMVKDEGIKYCMYRGECGYKTEHYVDFEPEYRCKY